jgi:thiamine biosynthesis lipoprotein
MVGIRNPFDTNEVVKIVHIQENGIATSGNYERGKHIYDPHRGVYLESEILSMTVIGPNIYEADRFATAAFAMGKDGITFIEQKEGLEGYAIDKNGIATMTSHFDKYTENHENN